MKTAFWLGLVLGFGGVLCAAHFVPWVTHARVPSQTKVVANGGRAEQFVIRLPVDRIGVVSGTGTGLRAGIAGAAGLPPALAEKPVLVEHFKVRDAAGNVIGLAARHWSGSADGGGAAWSLLIPSRGALFLAAPAESRDAVDAALQRAGYKPGQAWTGELKVDLTPKGGATGTMVAGSDEFGDLQGRYEELWTVTGVTETGELRGTIELDTLANRGS